MVLKSYQEAIAIIKSIAVNQKLVLEKKPIDSCIGFICANDITAGFNMQPFDNSAMDGFMVLADDLKDASANNEVVLKNTNLVAAGDSCSNLVLNKGCCMQVMTGAIVAKNAEAVVPVEDVEIKGDLVYFKKPIEKEKNIRRKGQDIQKGELAIAKNTKIEPKHIVLLASLGVFELEVYKKPKILYLSTGNELVESGNLQNGQIYNSNLHYSLAYLKCLGVCNIQHQTIKDNKEDFTKIVTKAIDNGVDIVISSGAVSAGKFDFVKSGLEELNAKIMYHKLKLRPGKPNLFALLPNNAVYFGLPGNPMANIVGLRFFVTYYIAFLQNKALEEPSYAICNNDFTKKEDFRLFLKGNLTTNSQGVNNVTILQDQASFMVKSFSQSNCFVIAKEDISTIKQGNLLEVYKLLPDFI